MNKTRFFRKMLREIVRKNSRFFRKYTGPKISLFFRKILREIVIKLTIFTSKKLLKIQGKRKSRFLRDFSLFLCAHFSFLFFCSREIVFLAGKFKVALSSEQIASIIESTEEEVIDAQSICILVLDLSPLGGSRASALLIVFYLD